MVHSLLIFLLVSLEFLHLPGGVTTGSLPKLFLSLVCCHGHYSSACPRGFKVQNYPAVSGEWTADISAISTFSQGLHRITSGFCVFLWLTLPQ